MEAECLDDRKMFDIGKAVAEHVERIVGGTLRCGRRRTFRMTTNARMTRRIVLGTLSAIVISLVS